MLMMRVAGVHVSHGGKGSTGSKEGAGLVDAQVRPGVAGYSDHCTNLIRMDKHLHVVLLFALCTGTCIAQTLTDANSIPAVGQGETRTFYNSPTATGWTLTGTGNTWDATAVVTFGVTATMTYRAPGDSPFASLYPSTTLCGERVQNGNTEWRHYLVDASHAEMIGISAENFSGGRTYCTYPFSIGSTFTDSWSLNGNNYTDTYTYVASGEVQAPWGTIPDVVMFETGGGFSYYLYLANNVLDPIGDYTPGFGINLWKVDAANGITEAATMDLAVLPNPATEEVVLTLPSQRGFMYSMTDATGHVLLTGSSIDDRAVLDLRSCAAGVYHVSATDARGRRAVARVFVE
jgi:hypothetical protein